MKACLLLFSKKIFKVVLTVIKALCGVFSVGENIKMESTNNLMTHCLATCTDVTIEY